MLPGCRLGGRQRATRSRWRMLAASFQEAVADVLTRKALAACHAHGVSNLIIGRGSGRQLAALRALAAQRW